MGNVIYDGGYLGTSGPVDDILPSEENNTSFASVYNCFLSKITDDMYLELTPEDTLKDLQNLLLNAVPGFEFPRINLNKYIIETVEVAQDLLTTDYFVIGSTAENIFLVERSFFEAKLTQEEINIIALLMLEGWI
jgi:hypothetical protein